MDNYNSHDLVKVMALHSLHYCERLCYLEEVEENYLTNAKIFSGRSLHESLKKEEEETGEWTSIELSNESVGLIGKVDAVRYRDGSYIPYEHKNGRSNSGKGWLPDIVQVSAYAMLLEKEYGTKITEGRIRYHKDNVLVKILIDSEIRSLVINSINTIRNLKKQVQRPPITTNEKLCVYCSLAPICLPEEERYVEHIKDAPIRLFPKNQEKITVHVVDQGSRIGKAGDVIKITNKEGKEVTFPYKNVGSLVLHGFSQISTQLLHFCSYNNISVHWLTTGGKYISSLANNSGNVQTKIRQYEALTKEDIRLHLTKTCILAKVSSQLRYILRSTKNNRNTEIDTLINDLRYSLRGIAKSEDVDSIRGYEGIAGKNYFTLLSSLIKNEVSEDLHFCDRNRRPPKDRFNAILSFGYSLLYQLVLQSVLTVGLEPSFGFFHTPRSAAYPLVMDVMELFRVMLWDMVVIGSLNRMQWDPINDFNATKDSVWLSNEGKKKAIQLFEKRLEDTWKHPIINYSMSYSRLVELEIRLLEKEWCGKPGMFAKMRLR
jgi:CRISPR-associated protein Cas1